MAEFAPGRAPVIQVSLVETYQYVELAAESIPFNP
jgi:hypothetical protein